MYVLAVRMNARSKKRKTKMCRMKRTYYLKPVFVETSGAIFFHKLFLCFVLIE